MALYLINNNRAYKFLIKNDKVKLHVPVDINDIIDNSNVDNLNTDDALCEHIKDIPHEVKKYPAKNKDNEYYPEFQKICDELNDFASLSDELKKQKLARYHELFQLVNQR